MSFYDWEAAPTRMRGKRPVLNYGYLLRIIAMIAVIFFLASQLRVGGI